MFLMSLRGFNPSSLAIRTSSAESRHRAFASPHSFSRSVGRFTLLRDRFLAQGEEFLQLAGGQLRQPPFARSHEFAGQLFLALDHLVDLFLQCTRAKELVDLDAPRL